MAFASLAGLPFRAEDIDQNGIEIISLAQTLVP
jgi:hypothetical protein